MLKQVQFRGADDQGNIFCLPLLDRGMEKTASALQMRSKLHPKVQDFVGAVRPTAAGIYVLVNALGAGEYWGSNVNGDLFPEKALIHSPPEWEKLPVEQMRTVGQAWPYGYPTFMGAYPYKHHVNKDPSRAFGRVELAVWNPDMHRVELVVYLDRALCMQFDAMDIIERIERGEFPDVSMGCKVPYDICTICEHKSKTPKDYCEHAARMMNKILPDGRKVAVRNDFPRFFDISFVFIGADKTAKVMAKIAQQGNQVCMGDYCTIPRPSAELGEMFSAPEITEDKLDSMIAKLHERKPYLEKRANDPIKKSIRFDGLNIGLEWLKGENREYKSKTTGKVVYSKLMKADYGYIKNTKDNDGEELDVYVGPNRDSNKVFIVRQLKKDGTFDEHKVMLGYDSGSEAKSAYLDHMPDNLFDSLEGMDMAEFKKTNLKEAKEMAKEAGDTCPCHGMGDDCGGTLEKFAAALFPGVDPKTASHRKTSEIIKSVPAGPFTEENLPKLEQAEQNIPKSILDLMSGMGLGPACSTTGMMGVVLKPSEFQRVMLVRIGAGDLADELDAKNMTFGHTDEVDDSIPVDQGLVDPRLKELLQLSGVFKQRTIASPALRERAGEASRPAGMPPGTSSEPVMDKIAAAYNGYRRSLIKKANQIGNTLELDPQLRADLFGRSMVQAFAGGVEKTGTASVLGPDSLAYLVGAFHKGGKPLFAEVSV